MNFELNKVAGAVLGTLLFVMGSGFLAELIYAPKPAGRAGYPLPEPQLKSPTGGKSEAPKAEPIATRLASADAAKGEAGTKACKGCHTFDKGGANGIGPSLWDVVERPKGGHPGFGYSAALKAKGGAWSYEDLDHFLESPKGFVKDTKMVFPGIASPQERANVIAYLRSLSDNPKPLPASEPKGEAAKPAEGAKPVGDSQPEAAKPEAVKPEGEAKPAEAKPTDAQPAADKPTETKPAEQNSAPEKSSHQ